MATATASYATGGKVWNFRKGKGNPHNAYQVIGSIAVFSIVCFLFMLLIPMMMAAFNFKGVDLSGILTTPKTNPFEVGYPIRGELKSTIFGLPFLFVASLAAVISSTILFILNEYQTEFIHKITLVVMLCTTITMSGSFLAQSILNASAPHTETWIQERYGFQPIIDFKNITLQENMLIREKNTNVIAEVKEHNGAYFLYDLDGKELPIAMKEENK